MNSLIDTKRYIVQPLVPGCIFAVLSNDIKPIQNVPKSVQANYSRRTLTCSGEPVTFMLHFYREMLNTFGKVASYTAYSVEDCDIVYTIFDSNGAVLCSETAQVSSNTCLLPIGNQISGAGDYTVEVSVSRNSELVYSYKIFLKVID